MSKQNWSNAEIQILKDNYNNLPITDISFKINRSIKAIQLKASRLHLTKNDILTQKELDFLINNYKNKSNKEIAKYLNKNIKAVRIQLKLLGLERHIKWDTNKFKNYVNTVTNGKYECKSEYINNSTHVMILHKNCNTEYPVEPNNFIQGYRCPFCFGNKKSTTKEFINKLNTINENILVLGEYKNNYVPIKVQCKICNHVWYPTPSSLIYNKTGCPNCAGIIKLSHTEFINKVNNINPNIIILSEYKGTKTLVKYKCLLDDYEDYATPYALLKGKGCKKCSGVSKPTKKELQDRLNKINPNILILGEYINHYTDIECKCLSDNYIFPISPHELLRGIGCPVCTGSKGEKIFATQLNKNNIKYISQYTFPNLKSNHNKVLRFDFAIFVNGKLFCLVEIDGEGHRRPIKFNSKMTDEDAINAYNTILRNDELKNKYCLENEIKLIRLEYDTLNKKDFNKRISYFIKEIYRKEVKNVG